MSTENNSTAGDTVNEFNQYVKPVSLWADAWKRLRKNTMAIISLWVVGAYLLIMLLAPLLESAGILYSYSDQVIMHQNLPPSFKPAGILVIERMEKRIVELQKAVDERGEPSSDFGSVGTGFDFAPPADIVFDDGTTSGSESPDVAAPEEEGGYSAGSGFDFAPASDIVFDDGTTAAAETSEGGEDSAATLYQDPMSEELERTKAELEEMRINVDSDPVNRKVYILGTDDLGRDMLARVIYGGRISMMIGLVGTLTAVLIGIIIGAISGYAGGTLDNLLMRFVDIMYGLPYMLVVIIIMSFAGNKGRGSMVILFVALALISWLTIARVVRGQIISLKNSEFVEAAKSMGASTPRIIFRHLLPNTLGVIIVFATLLMPNFIMQESFLSFLGLGISAPQASWGTLVSDGVKFMELYSWMLFVPAISMTVFLFCMNFLGDGLRDALDPQSKNRT